MNATYFRTLVFAALCRLALPVHAAPGDLDPLDANLVGTLVRATAVQPDGKTIIAGNFTSVLGVARSNIARLNANGTLDAGFNPKPSGEVLCVAVQTDGKVLIGGNFFTLQPNGAATPTSRSRIARLNADGSLDTGFNPNPNTTVNSIAVQADGRVLLGGTFTTLQPNGAGALIPRNCIARVNTDGTLDTGFDPKASTAVTSIAVQADGKVLLGGSFTTLQPNGAATTTARSRIARVNADGTLDAGFDPKANATVFSVAIQADGKVLLGGSFTTLQPNGAGATTARSRIARVNANGTLDASFDPKVAGGDVHSLAVQANGQVLLAGAFTTLQPNGAGATAARQRIARVNADGTLDAGFDPKADNIVNSVSAQPDGKVLLGGSFTTLQPNGAGAATARNHLARLENDSATQTLTVPDATSALWQRGGAGPELSRVTSDISADGGANWFPLGTGTRIGTTADWQITGQLSGNGTLRARGVTAGGYQNGSSGLIDQMTTYSVPLSNNADLSALTTTAGPLTPAFAAATTAYATSVSYITSSTTITPTKAQANATIQVRVNGGSYASVASGGPSGMLALNIGTNLVDVLVTAHNGTTTRTYSITVTRPASPPGDVDLLDANIAGGSVLATVVQPDGKTIIAGSFTSVLGVPRNNIARLNVDGTLDAGFDPNANSNVFTVAVQTDGKVLLGGAFNVVSGGSRQGIARLNTDGTLDAGFDPSPNNYVSCVAVQPDGKVLLGGSFNYVQGVLRQGIARVNADGVLDGFDPEPNGYVRSVAVQADGKVLLAGEFNYVGAVLRQGIARVNADGILDGFDPEPNSYVESVAVQADGKVLLAGQFNYVGALLRQGIARVNDNGVLDGFDPEPNGYVHSVAVQVDGKVLFGGEFNYVGAVQRQGIARVNADGTLDGFDPEPDNYVLSVAVQADGKVLLGGVFTAFQPNLGGTVTARSLFARITNDPAIQTLSAPDVTQMLWQRGGAAPELSSVIFDLSSDGGANWSPVGAGIRSGTTANWQRTGLSLSGSGQIRARGATAGGYRSGSSSLIEQITTYSGFPVSNNADLSALTTTAGTLTPIFAAGTTAYSASVAYGTNSITATPTKAQINAAIQVRVNGGSYASVASGNASGALALNVGANAVDVRVTAHDGVTTRIYTVTVTRTAPTPGDIDPLDLNVTNGSVLATAVQPDGKTIITGLFTSVFGVPRSNIARLNADGTLDIGFDPQANADVVCVAVQADGKVVLGGSFTTLQPNGAGAASARNYVARVNTDGTLDTGFNPNANGGVASVVVQADGKVVLGGSFTTLQPNGAGAATLRNCIARVNTDGTLDTGFDPKPNDPVYSVAVQTDGKVVLGGFFTTLQPNGAGAATARNYVARVNTDGTLDTGFDPKANNTVYCVVVQADGRVLLGGDFTTLQPNGAGASTVRNYIARTNADGTLDTGFNPNANFTVFTAAVQTDGKVLLGGSFTTLQPNGVGAPTTRNNVARLNANGTLDTGFNPNANDAVLSLAVQADGRVLLGGNFTTLQPNGGNTPVSRNLFARLLSDATTQTLSAPDATQALWQRGGAGPELSRVTFELSTNGGASWTPLGAGTRIGSTANWQRTGLTLPTSGQIRARGTTAGGFQNGSSGLIEQVISFGSSTPFQQWKLTHLGNANAPNDGDTDFDGLRTILEYATGGDPLVPGALPAGSTIGNTLAITFSRNTTATDVTLTVQGSDDLVTWTDLAQSTGGAAMVALLGGVTVNESGAGSVRTVVVRDVYTIGNVAHPRRFLRLRAGP